MEFWRPQPLEFIVPLRQPVDEGVTYVSRNHPLSITIAEYLFNVAMQAHGDRSVAARCGIIRSGDVNNVTVLFLLRLRYLIKNDKSELSSFAEECIVSGYRGIGDTQEWLKVQSAEDLFESATPTGNLSETDKEYWIATILKDIERVRPRLDSLAYERAGALRESYERLRRTIKGRQTTVEPLLPLDILTMSIVLPQPGI